MRENQGKIYAIRFATQFHYDGRIAMAVTIPRFGMAPTN